MIQTQSWLTPRDNSGASAVCCIRPLGGLRRRIATPGDFIVVSVKRLRLLRKVKTGEVHLALVARTRFPSQFLDGSHSASEQNSVILRNRKGRPLGTRLFGWVSRRLRRKKFARLLLLAGRHIV